MLRRAPLKKAEQLSGWKACFITAEGGHQQIPDFVGATAGFNLNPGCGLPRFL